jgi:hypothetical protein
MEQINAKYGFLANLRCHLVVMVTEHAVTKVLVKYSFVPSLISKMVLKHFFSCYTRRFNENSHFIQNASAVMGYDIISWHARYYCMGYYISANEGTYNTKQRREILFVKNWESCLCKKRYFIEYNVVNSVGRVHCD